MRSTSSLVALVVLVALATLSALGIGLAALHDEAHAPQVWGLWLDMRPTELRAQLDARGDATWTTRLEAGDWVLERTSATEHGTFELHEGRLVAIRAEGPVADDNPASPSFELSDESVLVRVVEGERVRTTVLSRTCPTHHDEAEQLAREHAPPR